MDMPKPKAGPIMKVIGMGLQDRVFNEMKKSGFSVERLTRELKEEGIKITAQSIRKFIKNTRQAQQVLISQDLHAIQEIKKLTMDYTNSIKNILKEVEEVKNTAKDEKDLMTYNQLIGRLYQGLELMAKLSGELNPQTKVDINIIYNEIDNEIETKMKHIKQKMYKNILDIDAEILEEDAEIAKRIRGTE